jgi:hypothetical protein
MLNKVIQALGVVPPGYSQDFKGLLMEGWAAFRGSTGIEGALKAMKTNAEHINKKYREASALPFTPHIGALVERNYQNARMHLEFIEKALANSHLGESSLGVQQDEDGLGLREVLCGEK